MEREEFESLKPGDRVSHCQFCDMVGTIASNLLSSYNYGPHYIVVWDDDSGAMGRCLYPKGDHKIVERCTVDLKKHPITAGATSQQWTDEVRRRLREREAYSPHWNPYPDGEG